MIPRLKPYLDGYELRAAFRNEAGAVHQFEMDFAIAFESRNAIAFAYGRSGLWAFFKALGIQGAEVVLPAYTCDVVAHAVVLSGNQPRFVDIDLHDYNMNLEQFAASLTEHTQAVIPTHLFGYPMAVDAVSEIVRAAENRFGHKIWIIQDCAHSFGARWKGKLVCNEGDLALFGMNISKMITSVFGGMLISNDDGMMARIRSWRDAHASQPGVWKSLRRNLYLLAVYPAFSESLYQIVFTLQEKTSFLDKLTKAYHLDGEIQFPPDYQDDMLNIEARVGRIQLRKYPEIIKRRRENALFYNDSLRGAPGLELPPMVEGATYSHYVIRVNDREKLLKSMAQRGVQLGQLIEYSIPYMPAYRQFAGDMNYPNSLLCSQQTINLPIHPALRPEQQTAVVRHLTEVMRIMD